MKILQKREKLLFAVLYVGVFLVNIKRILIDFDLDCEYAIAMSYRLARGDKMFLEMWEPHQTSAFLQAIFIKLYLAISGTTVGLVLFLNVVGFVVLGAVTYFLYRTLKGYVDDRVLSFMALFFLAVRPKDFIMLEFSNMQVYFAVLLFCCLFRYLLQQKKWIWLVGAAVCLCLEVLAYPSCLLVYLPVVVILFRYAEKKRCSIAIFSSVCATGGIGFVSYFVLRMGWRQFLFCIQKIIQGDGSHKQTIGQRLIVYLDNAWDMIGVLVLCGVIGIALCAIGILFFKKKRGEGERGNVSAREIGYLFVCAFFVALCGYHFISNLLVMERFLYLTIYIPIVIWACCSLKECNAIEKIIFIMGSAISGTCVVATLLLTNLSILTSIAYYVLGIMVALIPIGKKLCSIKAGNLCLLFIFIMVTLFRNGYIMRPMNSYNISIFGLENMVRTGPAIGICSNYLGPYIIDSTVAEWEKYVEPGDRVMVVKGDELVATYALAYLYENVEICVGSTTSTPTYDETLLDYWELNPHKKPNVVIVDCWYGQPNVPDDSWVMKWVEAEFGLSYIDGMYYRYYR